MLSVVRSILGSHPNRESFFRQVQAVYPVYSSEYLLIQEAYETAKREFREKYREGGERYFEHLRSVALILLVYLRVKDVNIVAAALLHDIIEDIPGWDERRVALEFNAKVSELVAWVSEPSLDHFSGDKETCDRTYHRRLLFHAPPDAVLIKLADRLHNLMTLWKTSKEKRQRKIRETWNFYILLAEKHTFLIHELETALRELGTE